MSRSIGLTFGILAGALGFATAAGAEAVAIGHPGVGCVRAGQFVQLDNAAFRSIKAMTPGPYTFILSATKEVPRRLAHAKKKTVGVRIPDSPVVQALVRTMEKAGHSGAASLSRWDTPMDIPATAAL